MKFQNIFLSSLLIFLVFQSVYAKNITNYNFYCVKDDKNACSKLQKKVADAVNSISQLIGKENHSFNSLNCFYKKIIIIFYLNKSYFLLFYLQIINIIYKFLI